MSWNSIESIELVDTQKSDQRAGQKQKQKQKQKRVSKEAYILVTPSVERPPLIIPVKCIASEKLKSNFLEALDAWGRRAKIDSRLREALAPQMDGSFTELWLSSLDTAPNLAALTPLKGGLELSLNQEHGLTIEKPLGSGGQGMTYLAADKMGKNIVLKETILPVYVESARKKAAAQFELQAALLKSLDHPGIVKLHDYFVSGNRAYLALEYLEGQTLEALVEKGPLPQNEVLQLAMQMADILIYLHSRTPPVVHRDFTPDNLIVDKDGRIKLIDFGTALLSDEGENRTGAAGKQNYLPPEQYRGKPCQKSDIYALGATIYFMLTGRPPEPLTTSNPALILPQIDQGLSKIVEKATALDLQKRYLNAEEVLADLKESEAKTLPRLVVSDQTALRLIVKDSDDGAIA